MSDTSTLELTPVVADTDEPYVSLTILGDMYLTISPTNIARAGEHNSALFKIVKQPSSLDQYACRAEITTQEGTTYRLVTNGEFRLTNDIAVVGAGRMQLVYSNGVDVTRKTHVAEFYVTGSINAVDESDPEFQDGLAQIVSAAFANVSLSGQLLAFYNFAMQPVASVVLPAGGGGGIPDVPDASGAYARTRTPAGTDWTDFNTLRVASLDSPQFAGSPSAPSPPPGDTSPRLATAQFVAANFLDRAGGAMSGPFVSSFGAEVTNVGLGIGDPSTGFFRVGSTLILSVGGALTMQFFPASGVMMTAPLSMAGQRITALGDATLADDAMNRRSGDARYLPLGGGTLAGNLQLLSPAGPDDEIGLYLGGRDARIYWGNAIVMQRGGAGESVYIENHNGSNRSEVLTQLLGDARYLQPSTADARYLQLIAGGIVAGPVQILTAPVIANDAANKGYVDTAVAAAVAPTAFRTFAYTPNDFTIAAPSAAAAFLDVNVTLPTGGTGIRNVLVSIEPLFAANDPQGTMWELFYSTDLIALEVPVEAYKISNNTSSFFRSSAKIVAAVDASSGSIRVQVRVRCTTVGPALTQAGVGGTLAPDMRTVVTVQDLGPAI